MSRITELTDRTLQNAAKARGQWTPDPDSRHYQMYVDFHTRKKLNVPKRGRCEYFHKVIRQAFYEARRFFLGLLLVLLGLGLLYLFLNYPTNVLSVLVFLGAVAYLVLGMSVSAHIAERIAPDLVGGSSPIPMRWYDKLFIVPQVLLAVLAIPAALGLLTVVAILSVIAGVAWLVGALLSPFEKPARWFFFEQPFGRRGFIWIRPWMLVAIAAVIVVAFAVPGFAHAVYIPIAQILGSCILIGCVFYAAAVINTSSTQRRKSFESERERMLIAFVANHAVRQLFLYNYPQYQVSMDEQKFAVWLARYSRYCEKVHHKSYDLMDFSVIFCHVDAKRYMTMFDETPSTLEWRLREEFARLHPASAVKPRRWYHTMVELMAFVWAGISAAKQRVCPIVIYPPATDGA